jgi:putative membrane protein
MAYEVSDCCRPLLDAEAALSKIGRHSAGSVRGPAACDAENHSRKPMKIYRSKSVSFTVALCTAGLFLTRLPAARADTDPDRDFIRQATEEVMTDAEISRVARDKGEHEEVRHFAAERVKTDEKMESELRNIADRHHVGVPGKGELAKDARDRIEHLQTSERFDREYLSGEVRDSAEMAKLFEHAYNGATDPDLRGWFGAKKDTLRDQHEQVKTLDDRFDR